MNPIFIPAITILQNIWWLIQTLLLEESDNFVLCLLISLSLFFRFLSVATYKSKKVDAKILFLILMANNVCYTETNILIVNKNSFLNQIDTLIILFNYQEGRNANQNESLNLVFDFGFPLYFFIRQIAQIFVKFDLQLCEGTIVLASILFFIFAAKQREYVSQKSCTKQDTPLQLQSSIDKQVKNKEFRKTVSIGKFKQVEQGLQIPGTVQINIKDSYREGSAPIPSFHSKLKPGYKSQFSHLVIDKADSQLSNFYQNLVNILPLGVIMINRFQQIQYMSSKCEKLVDCDGKEKVIEYIRTCVSNCELPEEANSMVKSKNKLTQRMLEEIIRIYRQNKQEIDVFDVLLNPNKYISVVFQGQQCSSEIERSSQESILSATSESSFCFECNIDKDDEEYSKRLKFILIQTKMTCAQQEAISQYGVSDYKKSHPAGSISDIQQPILLILIKNTTHKQKVKELKQETIVNSFLLKSFSHELRTPLNSCQHMLNIIKDLSKDQQILSYLSIAQSSIKLLIHQINDILDFSALQSNSFSIHTTTFSIEDLLSDIQELYCEQVKQKSIKFEINCDKSLKNQFIINDKQRITQVLVNLLNNSCKYTKVKGNIILTLLLTKENLIRVQVKDDGIGIKPSKLLELQRHFCKPSSKLSFDQTFKPTCLGFGLNISAKLIQGLAQGYNVLNIKSKDQKGTKISFFFQNYEIQNNECLLSPLPSNITGRFEMISPATSNISQRFDMTSSLQIKNAQIKIESPQNESTSFKDNIDSPRLNDLMQINSVVIPTSRYNFKQSIYAKHKVNSMLSFHINVLKPQCDTCAQVLIVDDVPFNQIAFTSMLNHRQIKSDSAYDGYQAIEMVIRKAQKHCKYYKIIFMDIEMPGQNGFETSKTIKSIPNIQSIIVMCSAYDTIENYNLAQSVGITEFLPKPVNQKDLDQILRKYQFKI